MNSFGEGRTVCSFCGEDISASAKRCPYCGSILNRESNANNDDIKTEGLNRDSSSIYNSDSYSFGGLFDNSINTDTTAKDFINEEKINEKMDSMLENLPDDLINDKSGLFDEKPNVPFEEKIEISAKEEEFSRNSEQKSQEFGAPYRPVMPSPMQNNMQNNMRPQRPPLKSTPDVGAHSKPTMSNAMKVFMTSLATFVPGLGQLIGVIAAIVFMNTEGDTDKRSFGLALLINSIVIFVLWIIACCILGVLSSEF